jgi:ketosteroid isomerase-like protein
MGRTFTTLLALSGALVLALAPAADSSAPPPGPGAVISMHIQLMRAIDGADADKAASFVGPKTDTSMFFDRDERPEVIRGRAAVAERLSEWARESRIGNYSTKVTPIASDCFSGDLSYAVLEIERSMKTTSGGSMVVERYVSTSLVQYREGGWKLMHWHLSPASAIDPALRPSSERNARAGRSDG